MCYEDDLPTLKRWAPRYVRRAHAAGARSVTAEDVLGEMGLAWTIASQRFDPGFGVPWRAYLARGTQNHINRWIDEQIGHAYGVLSLDEGSGEDGDGGSHDWLVADQAPGPDAILEEKDMLARAMSELSPEAGMFVRLLASPPPSLYEEMSAIQARAEHARSRGIVTSSPKAITGCLVLDLMGVERVGRHRIYREIRELGKAMSEEINQ